MWIPAQLLDWLHVSKDAVASLREEVARLTTERDALRSQVITTQANFEWVRTRVNALEVERSGLIEKAYGIKLPTPEVMRSPTVDPALDPRNLGLFDDIGESLARKLGLPSYDN